MVEFKAILVIFIVIMGPDGKPVDQIVAQKVYNNMAECNAMGENFRERIPNLPEDALAFSTCIDQSAFEEK